MMGLVVEDQNIPALHQFLGDVGHHLTFGLKKAFLAVAAAQYLPIELGKLLSFSQHEGVKVGDHDPRAPDCVEQIGRH